MPRSQGSEGVRPGGVATRPPRNPYPRNPYLRGQLLLWFAAILLDRVRGQDWWACLATETVLLAAAHICVIEMAEERVHYKLVRWAVAILFGHRALVAKQHVEFHHDNPYPSLLLAGCAVFVPLLQLLPLIKVEDTKEEVSGGTPSEQDCPSPFGLGQYGGRLRPAGSASFQTPGGEVPAKLGPGRRRRSMQV